MEVIHHKEVMEVIHHKEDMEAIHLNNQLIHLKEHIHHSQDIHLKEHIHHNNLMLLLCSLDMLNRRHMFLL
jgi:hypothetical protein